MITLRFLRKLTPTPLRELGVQTVLRNVRVITSSAPHKSMQFPFLLHPYKFILAQRLVEHDRHSI